MSHDSRPFTWLHISDFHFKSNESYDRDVVLRSLIKSVPALFSRVDKPDFIVASGDIAHSGKASEYVNSNAFFDDLLSACSLSRDKLIVVPGNHDVDRSKGAGLVRTLSSRQDSDNYFEENKSLIHIQNKQSDFKAWYDSYFKDIRVFNQNSTCSQPIEISLNDFIIKILPINTAAFCHDDHDSGKLWIGRRCLDKALKEFSKSNNTINIAVMHHPFSWLHQVELANIKAALRGSVDCILTGHLHSNDIEQIAGVAGGAIQLSAGATYQTRDWPNTALLCGFRNGNLTVLPIRYEDSPTEVWTVDTSLFHDQMDFHSKFSIDRFTAPLGIEDTIIKDDYPNSQTQDIIKPDVIKFNDPSPQSDSLPYNDDLESELLATANGDLLFAEPRLMPAPQEMNINSDDAANQVSIQDIIASNSNFIIQTRPEYGGTTLCKKLYADMRTAGIKVYLRNARTLPNYRKKLEREFPNNVQQTDKTSILIIDHFDAERDDRLIKELIATKWFSRFLIIVVDRSALQPNVIKLDIQNFSFETLYLWSVSRGQLRHLAGKLLDSTDANYISRAVDKVYGDLLSLCIPVTPSNAIMYLRILHREGEYHPLNRVDIVGRYLQEVLRANSNISVDAFNAKSKSDFLSELCYKLFSESLSHFDDNYWYIFCREYQARTLLDFDAPTLFFELTEARVLVRSGPYIFFKYHFFFAYFVGRSIAFRGDRLSRFMENEDYLSMSSVLDVITGLSTDNTTVIRDLTSKLKIKLNQFSVEYIDNTFDPLSKAIWPDNSHEEEKLWKPITQEIDAGPKSTTEIDIIKTSAFSESLTVDQTIKYNRFKEMEHSLFVTASALTYTLRNADDVDGDLKLDALDAILHSHFVALQIGTVFSSELARRRFVRWGGLLFVDFNKVEPSDTPVPLSDIFEVINSLFQSISSKAAEELGSYKLTGVYRARIAKMVEIRSYELMNFAVTLSSKGPKWAESLTAFINKTDKNSYYLTFMLDRLMRDLSVEVLNTKDRDSIKLLVALIHTKRSLGKQNPGAKAVNSMLKQIEKNHGFDNQHID